MDLRLRRRISVRDLSAIRSNMVGSMLILAEFCWHTQATYMKDKVVSFNLLCVAGIKATRANCGQNKK